MARAIPLRSDVTGVELRRLARRGKDAAQARRLLALAAIYDGATRSEAARLGHVTLQIVRDWVLRFHAEGPEGLRDRKAPGPTPLLTDAHREALASQIDQGPIPAIHSVVRWRLSDLVPWLWEEFTALRALPAARVSVSMLMRWTAPERHRSGIDVPGSRLLRAMSRGAVRDEGHHDRPGHRQACVPGARS
jgi:transposase